MATNADFVDYILELMESFCVVSARRMFGGYGVYREGLMFGLISDDILYLKVDSQNRQNFENAGMQAFKYDKKGKQVSLSYFQAPEEALDNSDEMSSWASSAYDAALRNRSK